MSRHTLRDNVKIVRVLLKAELRGSQAELGIA